MMNNPEKITTYTVVCLSSLSILAALTLSYTALWDLFNNIGLFNYYLAFLFPLLFDLVEVSAAIAVFNAKLQNEEDSFAWRMVLAFTGLGIVANIIHALYAFKVGTINSDQLFLAVFATSLFPLSVALVTHLVKRVIERNIKGNSLTLRNDDFDTLKNDIFEKIASQMPYFETMQNDTFSAINSVVRQLEALEGKLEGIQNEKIVVKQLPNPSKREQVFKVLDEYHGVKTPNEIMEIAEISSPTYYKYVKEYTNGKGE